jgi:hypothetical protein
MIARRHVFLIIGYAPIKVETQHLWFKRSFEKFGKLWGASGRVSELIWNADNTNARWNVETQGPNWRVETTYEPLNWDDIIHSDVSQPIWSQITGTISVFFEYLWTGTLWRYFRGRWTYGLFFLLPFFHLAVFAGMGLVAAWAVTWLFGLSGWPGALVFTAVAIAGFVGGLYWPGKKWHTQHILVDWIFSRDFARDRRPDMNARLAQFAKRIVERVKANTADEILVVGHCLGAGLAADVLSRALDLDPMLTKRGPKLCFMTIGATLPKFALHPGGEHIRRAAKRVAEEPGIAWAEYHSREDAISFYKFDPVALKRQTDRIDGKPVIRRVRLKDMVEKPTWKRIRYRFLRMHIQSFLANERRTPYDYFMFVCGPIPFTDATVAPGGPTSFIAEDGSYSATASLTPTVTQGKMEADAADVVRAEEML